MSSSQPFLNSSPISLTAGHRRKSQFTYKHLSLLGQSSTSCPLRVIAHIDLDAFYAQCEGVRLNIAQDQPLAVQQWSGLIAINYPARKFGVKRFTTIGEAKKLCPDIILQHVATWKEGEERWAYHQDAFAHMATHKVSLDPYRLESRRILACIKDTLRGPPIQKVEKASIDEVFLDLSAQIHAVLLERYPELSGPAPYDDPTESLPRPPTTALDWNADALVDLDNSETEDDDPDWDDIAMLIGSEIVRTVRAAIRERLKYTCSAGVARNKMIAKLGSAHKKPNQQTVIRNRAVQQFLGDYKFTKIRNLGGKLGEEVVTKFATEEVKDLLLVPIEQLKSKVGDDTGSWLFHIIRGEDHSEVNSRTQIKSMLSAKSFRPSINTSEQAVRWLRIFAADIFSRLVEEGVVENRRRPKTINLHHRQGGQMRSKQAPIPSGRPIDEALLSDLAQNLLGQIVVDGRVWPCSNLQLSVGGFEDGPTKNRGIGGFLVRGDEAKAMITSKSENHGSFHATDTGLPMKRRKLEDGALRKFLTKSEMSRDEGEEDNDIDNLDTIEEHATLPYEHSEENRKSGSRTCEDVSSSLLGSNERMHEGIDIMDKVEQSQGPILTRQPSTETYTCIRCKRSISVHQKEEHEDWHFAKNLQSHENSTTSTIPVRDNENSAQQSNHVSQSKMPKKFTASRSGTPNALGKKVEKGQKRLAFG
ncbi:MAG: DNA-directed DNA polymerase eta rad30 [Heterodermia speciosa]|uniref:DNA polymerase eta n=1 Tax=Heterodermia speciosa TaxID=116794 RepID=A0A8H3IN33_9LECA|nr:MAG: DNA-directed DNA polymerase eta rad30 [Heterodermia speciosa]